MPFTPTAATALSTFTLVGGALAQLVQNEKQCIAFRDPYPKDSIGLLTLVAYRAPVRLLTARITAPNKMGPIESVFKGVPGKQSVCIAFRIREG